MITAPNANQLYAVYGHPWLADDGSIKLADISGDNGFVTDGNSYSVGNQILAGVGNQVVMLGDVNGDGFADTMAAGSPYGAILTFGASTQDLLDAATGTDELIINIAAGGLIQTVLAAGDFNGDGLADIGVLDQNNNFYLSLGNTNLGLQQRLTLSTSPTFSVSDTTTAVAVGDYNGDGYDDLLLTVNNQQQLYKGNRSGTLTSNEVFTANGNTVFNSIGDINGDGYDDIGGGAPSGSSGNGGGTVYLGNATASSASGSTLIPPTSAVSADLNNSSWQNFTYDSQQTKFNSAPSFAVFNGYLYMAYTGVSNSSKNGSLYVQRSADGYNWEGLTNFGSGFEAGTGFSLAVYQGALSAAYIDQYGELIYTYADSADNDLGLTFNSSNNFNTGTYPSYVTPVLVNDSNNLYMYYATGNENQSEIDFWYYDGSWKQGSTLPNPPNAFLPLGASFAVTTVGTTSYVSFATGDGSSSATGLTFGSGDGSTWSLASILDSSTNSVLRGTGLLSVGNTLYNFYLPSSGDINVITSTDQGSTWTSPSQVQAVSNQYWLTYPNPVYFNESVFLGYGVQLASGFNVDVSYAISNPIYLPNLTQQFGQQLEDIGDFNGDGIADFAVLAPGFFATPGAWNNQVLENNQGAVLIYYGSTTGFNSNSKPDVVLATPAPNASTNVANNQALLLTQMAPAGDVNGDGYDDLIIASPDTALDANNTTDGLAFVVFGGGNDLWGNQYGATNPFNLGIVTNNTNQLTLVFSQALSTSSVPATSAFTVNNGLSQVTVGSLSVESNQVILSLNSYVDLSGFVSVTYTAPSSGGLEYASAGNSQVPGFIASNDSAINTTSAITLSYDSSQIGQTQYGFSITGLPGAQSGISLAGGGDVNGDGFSDFLIGAPGDKDNLAYTLFGSDFNQTVNQTGTIGGDVMVGSPTGESFVAGQGDDLITTGGGVDVVYAGPGDDQVIVNDVYFRRLDGGAGTDTLFFYGYNGQAWDLTTLSPGTRLRDFEVLVTENYGANTLTLNALSVMQISPTNTLTVFMDGTDSLKLSSDFSYTGLVYQYNRNFSEYQSGTTAARVLVNQPNGNQVLFNAPATNSPAPILPTENNATVASAALAANNAGPENLVSSTGAETEATTTTNNTANGLPTQIYVSSPTVSELNGRADFTLTRTGDLAKSVLVSYLTRDGDGKAGDRYNPVAGQLVFAPGETSKTVTVAIPNNNRYVGDRQFGLLVTLVKESSNLGDLSRSFEIKADADGQQIRRWSLVNSDTQQGLFGGTIQFDTPVRNGQAQINLSLSDIGDFNSFYNYNPQTSAYEELMLNASATGATFTYSPQNQSDTPDGIQLNFIQDGDRTDVDNIVNGLAKTNGYAGRTIPGLITNNNQTFWAATTADGKVQWRLIEAPTANYELGWIPVDDQNGTVNGLKPTDAGYEAAALSRKQVVFQSQNSASNSALTRTIAQESFANPSELSTTERQFFGNLANSNLEANRFYMLYTTAATETNFSVITTPEIETDSRGYHQLSFNGITAEIGSSTIVTPGVLAQSVQIEASLSRAAAYNNLIALYQVDSLTGGLDTNGDQLVDLQPGDLGYTKAALKRAQDALTGVTLTTPENLGTTQQTINLLGNNMYGMVIIPNATIEQVLSQNPSNNSNLGPVALFSFGAANPDGISHMARLGNNLFGFEDILGGGDLDYNDMILKLQQA